MSNRTASTYRGYLIDHHSPDPPIVTLEHLHVEEYERFFTQARINHLMVYCKDHWGVTYYDSSVGKKHPGLKEDWISRLIPVMRKLGIEFNAYYCIEYDSYAPVAHPEWSIRSPDGMPVRLSGRLPKWGMPCYETGYRQYVLTQLAEIVENFHPDTLFLDIFGKSLCYCDSCLVKFENTYGFPLPKGEALQEHRLTVNAFLDRCAKEMLEDILHVVKSIDPKLKVTINFAALYPKEIRDLLDFQFTEPFAGNWLSAAYARDTAVGQNPQLGPGDVSEVYNYQHENVYVMAASQIAAQDCRVFMYSGSQRPDGTLEHEEARRVGLAYREIERIEPYLEDRVPIADIGIIQSDLAASMTSDSGVIANAIERVKAGSDHRNAIVGAMKLCDYAKFSWKIIPEEQLDEGALQSCRVLILPDIYHVSEQLANRLRRFVKDGGSVIVSGKTGLYDKEGRMLSQFALSDLMGCQFEKVVTDYQGSQWGSYIRASDRSKDGLWKYMPETDPPASEFRYLVELQTGDALARFINPATELNDDKWVNWWYPPPSFVTDEPAVVANGFGKGQAIYFCYDFFQTENQGYHLNKHMFKGLLESLIPNPAIRLHTELPNLIGMAAYDRQERKEWIVHIVSHLAERSDGDVAELPCGSLHICKLAGGTPMAEQVYPDHKELSLTQEENGWRLPLPAVAIHQVIRIRYL
jgi:hypothetical protein